MSKILKVLIGVVLLVLLLTGVYLIKSVSWDFRNNLWGPAYLLIHGESAYNIHLLFDDSNAIWLPQIIGLFFLMGLLPQYLAANIWLLFNVAILVILVWHLYYQTKSEKPSPLVLGFLMLLTLLFPPVIRHLVLGQADIFLVLVILAGTYALEKRRWVIGGFFFALSLSKPQVCIVVFPTVLLFLAFQQHALRDALQLLLYVCLFGILLTIPLSVAKTTWLMDLIANLQNNPDWAQPNIFSILRYQYGNLGYVAWSLLYVGGVY